MLYMLMSAKLVGDSLGMWGLKRISKWELKFNFLPRRCRLSNKLLWLTYSYKGIYMLTGPGDTIFDKCYIEKSHFILWNLRGKK